VELPISHASYQPSTAALVRAARRARLILGRVVGEETALDHAVAITDPRRPQVAQANFAVDFAANDRGPAAALALVFDHFDAQGLTCLSIDAADVQWDDDAKLELSRRDYYPATRLLSVWTAQPPGEGAEMDQTRAAGEGDLQIIPARSCYADLRVFFADMAQAQDHADAALAAATAAARIDQLDEPRLEAFVARIDRRVAGVAGIINLGNLGVLSDVFTLPDARGQGLAAALMAHLLDHCRRCQFEAVLLDTPASCPHLDFFQHLGFSPATSYLQFRKRRG
jgi:GNAT superfamily N-acetyltransferase